MTHQDEFGGAWTQQKLEALGKYLQAYTIIFKKNPRAQYYSISYLDAFAGTGSLQRPEPTGLAEFMPELLKNEEHYRKGSVLRALEIEPPFDYYIFIEKNAEKCAELRALVERVRPRNAVVINEDANTAILNWCRKLDARQRAVVFLDPFGASVRWEVIKALGKTRAVDLWVLFPYSAINRMLVRDASQIQLGRNALTKYLGLESGKPPSTPLARSLPSSTRLNQSSWCTSLQTTVRSPNSSSNA